METILYIVLTLILLSWLIFTIIVFNKTLYCMVFERDAHKKWKFIIKNIDTFKISGEKSSETIYFVSPLLPYTKLVYWINEEEVTLHDANSLDCILSSFCEKDSKKVYNLLKNKYNL